MTRNLKAMGLALFAVLALGALGAQGASAAVDHTFTSDSPNGKTVLTGASEGTETFTLTGNPISCTNVSYRGTVNSNAVDEVSVVPVFGGATCTLAGNPVTIHNTGCTYTFDSDTVENTTHFAAGVEHAVVSITCNHPNDTSTDIVITGQSCTVTVETTHTGAVTVNHNLPGVRYTVLPSHSGGKSAITVNATVRTIKATTAGPNCGALGLGNPGTHSNGTYAGKAIITGYEDVKVFDPHTESAPSPTVEGPLVNISIP